MSTSRSQQQERHALTHTKARVDAEFEAFVESGPALWKLRKTPEGRLFFSYLKPNTPRVVAITALGAISTTFEAFRLIIILVTLKLLVGESGATETSGSVLGLGFDLPFLSGLDGTSGLFTALGLLGLATALKEGTDLGVNVLSVDLQGRFMYDVRRDLMDKLLTLESGYFSETKSGDLVYLQNTIVNRFTGLVPTIRNYAQSGLDLAVAILVLGLISVPLTLLLLGLAAGFFVLSGTFRGRTRRFSYRAEEASREASTHFLETVHGIRLVKLGGQVQRIRAQYLEFARRTIETLRRQLIFEGITGAVARVGAVIVLVLLAIGLNVIADFSPGVEAGSALGFLTIALRAVMSLGNLIQARLRLTSMVPHFLMIARFLMDDRYVEVRAGLDLPKISPIKDRVSVAALTFEYEAGHPVLRDVSLELKRGTITAVVGASGSGKTTLVELLAGYRSAPAGSVLVDGADLSAHDPESYREQVGYVTQDTIMFHDTFRNNIAFLKPEATDDEIAHALRLAAAEDFVQERGRNLDSMLGERGLKISGGQRQRIALARVLLQDPPLLLLDEATNGLDLYTEARVFGNLMEVKRDKIVLVVAHRLSAISRFDNIVVMHEGRVVEHGTHQELLAAGGLYYHLYGLQEYSPEASLSALSTL